MTMKKDNRVGAIMCHQLLSINLTNKEREFIMSINQKIILTANCVLTLPSVTGTGRFQIRFIQDSVGGRSVTFSDQTIKNPSSFDFSTGTASQECIATFSIDKI